jgi:hypothetical protein
MANWDSLTPQMSGPTSPCHFKIPTLPLLSETREATSGSPGGFRRRQFVTQPDHKGKGYVGQAVGQAKHFV